MGQGLCMIARMYGGIIINGEKWIWDYAQNTAVKESDLLTMKKAEREKRKAASEKAKWAQVGLALPTPERKEA